MTNKLIDMLSDRNGKLSLAKLSFFLGVILFLTGWSIAAFSTKTVPAIDSSLAAFLGVLSLNQLGRSYLANKSEENKNESDK